MSLALFLFAPLPIPAHLLADSQVAAAYIVFAVLAQIVRSVQLTQKAFYPFVRYEPQSTASDR